jgi:hypothetical protein
MKIHVTTNNAMPRGKIEGSGSQDDSEHWIQCHPLDIESACATVVRIARAHAAGDSGRLEGSCIRSDSDLDGVEVIVNGRNGSAKMAGGHDA